MLFGFAINNNGSTNFGITKENSEEAARQKVATETGVSIDDVVMMSAEEALNEYDEVAFLAPAELAPADIDE